jgi:hypothetical protein
MPEVTRIDPESARQDVKAGQALLVCAYDDRARCRDIMLDGAIDMDELEARLPTLRKNQPLIFYCG